jgi:alpha-mannosidase
MIVHMIGNAHIDPVWLWGWQVGVDEALATVASAADRCEEYPDFVFTRGEAWIYQQVERLRPDLFDRVRNLVARGQWYVAGGQYLQPDLNLPTEMGLRRQIQYGQAYFRETFGVRPRIGYQVDSFGQPGFVPDLLAEHGYIGYIFRRPEPQQYPIPGSAFRWRGLGGAEVLCFRVIPAYVTNEADLYGQVMIAVENAVPTLGHTMCFYGVGNHGGGPTKAQIEWIREHRSAFDGIELRFSTPEKYFDAIAPARDQLPLVRGELQHTFPGCYSVMHDIKQAQRRTEHLLDQAGRVAAGFCESEAERVRELARLDAAWKDLLLTEFHDVVTGTSVRSAWPSIRAFQGRARIAAEEAIADVTRRWSYRRLPRVEHHQIVIVNADESAFRGYVQADAWLDFDTWGERWLSDLEGRALSVQQLQPEGMQGPARILFPVEIPPTGSKLVLVRPGPAPGGAAFDTDLQVSTDRLANGFIDARLGATGITELSFKGMPVLSAPGIGLHLRRDSTDTWTFHRDRWIEPIEALLNEGSWVIEETGPLRVSARLEARLGNSRLRWTASLYRNDPRLLLDLDINFDERTTLLQMPIHLARDPKRRTDGLAIGCAEGRESLTEWPVQGWSRLGLDGVEIGLVTNDAYSASLDGQIWQWTLLRSPRMAWDGTAPKLYLGRDHYTDQGTHEFAFELHLGRALDEGQLRAAVRRQAQPLIVFDRYEGMNRPSFGAVPPRGIWSESIRRNIAAGRLKAPE